jgi:hypothetical protein
MGFKNECEFYWYGQTWKCMRVKELPDEKDPLGGLFDAEKKTIFINDCYDEESFLDYLHHELTEGALFLSACCYSRYFPDEKDVFVMDHTQMDLMSSAVRGAYESIKINIGLSPRPKKKIKEKDKEDKP